MGGDGGGLFCLVPVPGDASPFSGAAGIDEAGRGPLAGPVVAAAVVLPEPNPVTGVTDSKKLSPARREALYEELLARALGAGVGWAGAGEVDELNIANATFRAMERAVAALGEVPARIRVDGDRHPPGLAGAECLVGGDLVDPAIAAGSILAKVTRDRWMADYDVLYPGYGFARNKGYGTPEHRDALARKGPSPIHRRSFATVGPSPGRSASAGEEPGAGSG